MQGATGETVGRVVGLYTAEEAGAAMRRHAWVELIAGKGIAGDRYATGRGCWSDPRWPDQEVTLVEAEVAEALGLDASLLRRNIVTRGVRLPELIGVSFQVGDTTLRGVRPCDPCRYLETRLRPGLCAELRGRGGLRVAILTGGRICLDDRLVLGNELPR